MEPSKDQKLGAITHINYEFTMLQQTAGQLCSGNFVPNITLEAFLLHVRNCIDFLYTPKRKYDDVLALDFVEDITEFVRLRGERKEFEELLQNAGLSEEDLNKRLFHLTYHRVVGDARWPALAIANFIMRKFQIFYMHSCVDYSAILR
jgi:hypothetical protein